MDSKLESALSGRWLLASGPRDLLSAVLETRILTENGIECL